MSKVIISFFFFISCGIFHKPNKIDSVFYFLEKKYTNEYIDKFKNTPEKYIIRDYYSPFMSEFRSVSEEVEAMNEIFEPAGIYNIRDQAYVIIIAWHRKLNSKPLELEKLLEKVAKYYKDILDCLEKKKNNAAVNFQKLSIGDTIIFKMPVRISGNNLKSVAYYDCPTYYWEFDNNWDLVMKGMVIEKFLKGNPEEFFYKTEDYVFKQLRNKIPFEEIKILDTIQINLNEYGLPI